jgi:hypothetical protein
MNVWRTLKTPKSKTGYTYYGDLLGIANIYKEDAEKAYKYLDNFYNIVYSNLSNYCKQNGIKVFMLSDSLMVIGNNTLFILEKLSRIYSDLLKKDLYLRGAIVKGKLKFDPRLSVKNFIKQLPKDDTLARVVGLGKLQKGSRLIIEKRLVDELFNKYNDQKNFKFRSILNKISSLVDGNSELLCFDYHDLSKYYEIRSKLEKESKKYDSEIAIQYEETISLLEKCFLEKKSQRKNKNNNVR